MPYLPFTKVIYPLSVSSTCTYTPTEHCGTSAGTLWSKQPTLSVQTLSVWSIALSGCHTSSTWNIPCRCECHACYLTCFPVEAMGGREWCFSDITTVPLCMMSVYQFISCNSWLHDAQSINRAGSLCLLELSVMGYTRFKLRRCRGTNLLTCMKYWSITIWHQLPAHSDSDLGESLGSWPKKRTKRTLNNTAMSVFGVWATCA